MLCCSAEGEESEVRARCYDRLWSSGAVGSALHLLEEYMVGSEKMRETVSGALCRVYQRDHMASVVLRVVDVT